MLRMLTSNYSVLRTVYSVLVHHTPKVLRRERTTYVIVDRQFIFRLIPEVTDRGRLPVAKPGVSAHYHIVLS